MSQASRVVADLETLVEAGILETYVHIPNEEDHHRWILQLAKPPGRGRPPGPSMYLTTSEALAFCAGAKLALRFG